MFGNPLNDRSMPKKMRDRMVKRVMDIQKEHFIPTHCDTFEEINKEDDKTLQNSLRSHEIIHNDWAVANTHCNWCGTKK